MSLKFEDEVSRRRTFAIISHPDAGKTTITEKILYNGNIIREAGEVKGKKGTKAATSDWMTMEQERGVSITSSVMNFDYKGLRINLLDTPGHKDFGEDTYRTLHAADCTAMLIDSAKGVEAQTRKLYEVCKLRQIPVFTFANKMDREGIDPLDLIDDVEKTLGMSCYPVTWPIGMGGLFKGLYHRFNKKLYLYSKGEEDAEVIDISGWQDPIIEEKVGPELYAQFAETIELLEGALPPFSKDEFLEGKISPMTFGSAKNNWGVDLFLDLFCENAPEPEPRTTSEGVLDPKDKKFSGFVFKIQANMDRKHRDRVAFIRVCSGTFDRGMKVYHSRLERDIRLSYATSFMAQDRETVEVAYSGDIVGITDTGNFQIGDTVTEGKKFTFEKIPRFAPEIFGRVNIKDPLKRRKMHEAIQHLVEEGLIQFFYHPSIGRQDAILGVLGELQFEVLLYRLKDEYGLEAKLERLPFELARWVFDKEKKPYFDAPKGMMDVYLDNQENPVILLNSEWDLKWLERDNPELKFSTIPS